MTQEALTNFGEPCFHALGSIAKDVPMVHFPVSGVEVDPLVPLLVAFAVSALSAPPAGVSRAFLLLPFQVSVLAFTSPALSPTNLVYNIFATPGEVYRYVRTGNR